MSKNGTVYKNKGGIYHPLTNTHQVLNPDGSRLEQRLSDEEQAVKGKGSKASAKDYPFRYLGEFNSITALNTALNEIFYTTDPTWQGSLRALLNGQVVFVQQMAIFITRGDWVQVVLGMVQPSQDTTLLIQSSTPGIFWRSRDTGNNTVVRNDWQSLSTLVLKTVNNQSLIGEGNIEISGSGGSITIDSSLDTSSTNAIQNKAVASKIAELVAAIENLPDSAGGGVIVCKQWAQIFIAGTAGDYAYNTSQKKVYQYSSGAWVAVGTDGTPQTDVIYINALAHSACYWSGTDMVSLLGEAPLSAVNVNSSAPVNSKAVADYVEKERKVVKLTYWGNLTQDANIGEYGYDTNDNQIYLFTDSVDPQGSWVSIGTPKEDLLYLREELSTYYHYDGDEMIAMLDADKMVPSIPETGGTSVFPTAAGVKNYVDGKDAAMKTYVDNAVANIDPSGESPTAKGFGTDNYGNPLFPEYYLPVTYNGNTVSLGTLYNSDVAAEKAAADAYIATIKWGINFYDWPLRCYNGSDTFSSYETSASTIAVTAPSERIMHKYGMEIDATTDNVKFDETTNAFVLVYDGKVYKQWANDYEWNDPVTDKARTDCVFSDISLEDDTDKIMPGKDVSVPQSKRVSYIYDSTEEDLVNIVTMMTNFREAYSKCMAFSLNQNGGQLHLSDRIYFIDEWKEWRGALSNGTRRKVYAWDVQTEVTSLDTLNADMSARGEDDPRAFYTGATAINKVDFTFDGGKGVLFMRTSMMGFPVNYCTRAGVSVAITGGTGTIRNLTLRTLRDRDNCIDPARRTNNNQALSCSDSCLDGISISGGHDLLIENIDIQGCNHDFHISGDTTRVTIKGWKSREGWQNVIKSSNIYFKDCDYRQREWAGAGQHMFYYQANCKDIFYNNCKFQMGKYSNAGIDLAVGSISEESVPRDIHFEGCELLGSSIFKGSGIASTWVYLHGCHIRQIYEQGTVSNGMTNPDAISISKTKWSFSNCLFSLINGLASGASAGARLDMVDCGINSESTNELISDLISVYADRVSTNGSLGAAVISIDSIKDDIGQIKSEQTDIVNNLSDAGSDLRILKKTISGSEYPQVDTDTDLPGYGSATDKYYIQSTGKVKGNPSGGVVGRSCYLISGSNNVNVGEEITTTVTFKLNNWESYPIQLVISSTTTIDEISAAIRTALYGSNGYGFSAGATDSDYIGKYVYDRGYLAIGAKHTGAGNDRTNYVMQNVGGFNIKAVTSVNKSNFRVCPAGENCTWEELSESSNGLVSRVASVEDKVKPDQRGAGGADQRPSLSDVPIGYCYLQIESSSIKPLWSAGTKWVDATGTEVI